jgi:hypothetical protein
LLAIALLPAGTSAGVVAVLAAALGMCTPPVAACLGPPCLTWSRIPANCAA